MQQMFARSLWAALVLAWTSSSAWAQPQQKVSPPEAQAWIDLATYSGFGMPSLGGGGGEGVSAMGMLGGLIGNATGLNTNRFGHTKSGLAGRWMDVTVSSRRQPQMNDALLAVPSGSGLAPTLKLNSPRAAPAAPVARADDERDIEPSETEKPRGKVSLYWGCGDEVRPGQPRVVDFANALPQDLMQIFNGRRATQRGTHSAAGHPIWPSEADSRMVPKTATLAGEMAFSGDGLPDNFRFTLPPAQDLMLPLDLQQTDAGGATQLSWATLPTARAYFVAAVGGKKGEGKSDGKADSKSDEANVVLWTSSELPDSGFGLVDYQTNAAVDRWLREKVLLAPATTRCTVPKGVFTDGGGLLRVIAFGNELNLAYPPRPTDVRQAWEPQWAVKVRLKSVASAVLGLDGGRGKPENKPEKEDSKPSPLDRLRNILGR